MTPNQVLKKTRVERKMSLEDMAQVLNVTRARVFQWEKGEPIPLDRIRELAHDSALPQWARKMAWLMWTASIESQAKSVIDQAQALGEIVSEAC